MYNFYMKTKGYLLVLSSLFIFSCSAKFIKNDIKWPKDTLRQKISATYKDLDHYYKNITIYTRISESAKIAQLEAFKYNMHIFSLVINKSNYTLTNYQDKTTKTGNMNDFKFINHERNFFKILKKTSKQPIIINNDNNLTLELRIIEETPI